MRPALIPTLIPALILSSSPALAHVGHLGDVAGHDHWVAGAAIGAAVLVGLWGALKGAKTRDTDAEKPQEPASDDEAQA